MHSTGFILEDVKNITFNGIDFMYDVVEETDITASLVIFVEMKIFSCPKTKSH